MTFKITKMVTKSKDGDSKRTQNGVPVKLPESHTCFNQLVLPGKFLNNYMCLNTYSYIIIRGPLRLQFLISYKI